MSVSPLMSVGTRAMTANYAALQTIGNNIANANTVGYSRQSVELATATGQATGSGYFGRGVDVVTVTRTHDQFLTREAGLSSAIAASDQARSTRLAQLEQVFPVGEDGLGHATGQLLNAFSDMASRPQDLAARQVVLARADEVASRFRAAGDQIAELQSGVTQDLKNSLGAVNTLAQQVAAVNRQISVSRGSSHAPNDLLDQRDRLIAQINNYVQVTSVPADDGSVGLFIGGGQRLVLGAVATPLAAVADPYDNTRFHLGFVEGSSARALPDSSLVGGSIAGLLRFQGQDLSDARNLLGQMATALSGAVNVQQSFGLDLRTPAGQGGPLLATTGARALPAPTNLRDASGEGVAHVYIAVVDPAAVQASDYELRVDPSGTAGAFQLTRLRDGLVRSVAAGDTVDGFVLGTDGRTPGAGDTFLLQPVAQAARNLQRVMADPRGLAAASPVTATVNPSNAGTARVAGVRVTDAGFDPALRAGISFTSGAGDYAWELRDGADAMVASGTGQWSGGQPIALNGWQLSLDGVPAAGDTLRVDRTAFPAGNNGNALALLGLRDFALVGRQTLPDGSTAAGDTFGGAYANALSDIGVRVQSARTAAQISQGVARNAETQRSGNAGVNLDEEAARLIQFQQSYQAAAKVLQVAQTTFDTLLQATSR